MNNNRDCPHGRQIGKCADCDVDRLEAENEALKALNAELVEALKLARSIIGHPDDAHTQMIDAAIAKATGEQT